jgi:hypothetical protein
LKSGDGPVEALPFAKPGETHAVAPLLYCVKLACRNAGAHLYLKRHEINTQRFTSGAALCAPAFSSFPSLVLRLCGRVVRVSRRRAKELPTEFFRFVG